MIYWLSLFNLSLTNRPGKLLRAWRQCQVLCTLMLFGLLSVPAYATSTAAEVRTVALSSGEDITLEVFHGGDELRILWITSTPGIKPRQRQVAQSLAQHNMEIWLVDLAESLFLPHSTQTLRTISPTVVAELINALLDKHTAPALLMSNSYGAIPTLRGIHAWQTQQPQTSHLLGVVLFSPNFFTHVPTLGSQPSFIPELTATNVPVYLYQEAKNGNRWHLPTVLEALQQHAPVYTEILPGVTSMFYDEDKSPATYATLKALPEKIQHAAAMLKRHEVPAEVLPVVAQAVASTNSGLDTQLKPYRGQVQPRPFTLTDAEDRVFEVQNFKHKVTVINFWATWCPPCVEEIPSLNRLKQAMRGKSFELISINYAETPQHIRNFMRKVAVDFPVLVDPAGELAGQWNVVAFPSTFVIGPDGKIRYGANAAIHWDAPAVIEQMNQLLQ